MQVLDVSNHKFYNITFDQFSHLLVLLMKNLDFETPSHFPVKKWFLKLKQLEELDMSGTKFGKEKLDILWPKKITKLHLAHMKLKVTGVIGLEALTSLEELYLNNNSLKYLPKLNESAPMKVINLNDNPILALTVEQVAPYCELISFTIQVKTDASVSETKSEYILTAPYHYNECIQIDEWFTKYFPNIHTGLMCQAPLGSKKRSSMDRNKCLIYCVFFPSSRTYCKKYHFQSPRYETSKRLFG